MKVFICILILVLLCSCQSVTKILYYLPTAQNKEYSTISSLGQQGHGPIKSIEGKSGSPDFGDKSFNFNLSVLGL